jgi:predicted amidophosphoribosyltransferase
MVTAFREQSSWFSKTPCILLVSRWLKAVTALLNADAAFVVLSDGQASRIICNHNTGAAFQTAVSRLSAAPYRPDETVILQDASDRQDIHAFLGSHALGRTGFFYRRSLLKSEQYRFSLVVMGEAPQPALSQREFTLAEEIAISIGEELERYYPANSAGLSMSMGMTRADMREWVATTAEPCALFDHRLALVAVSAPLRRLLPINWEASMGRPLDTYRGSSAQALSGLFRQALNYCCSTPWIDVVFEEAGLVPPPPMLRVRGSPIAPLDGDPLLIATVDASRTADPPRQPLQEMHRQGQEATAAFLLETMVRRRALRTRKDVSYVTLRCWRQSIRVHQISGLRAIKRNAPASIAAEIAAEIADDVRSLFGGSSFRAVVPMPCGHSAPGTCLSVMIAQALGRDMGLPIAHALQLTPEKGSSHPKANLKRPPMRLVTPVEGPVLLVDDVATSGRHIEEAVHLLRGAGASALAVAWIGGDSEKG